MATSLARWGVVRKLEGEVRGRKTLFFWKVSPEKRGRKGGRMSRTNFSGGWDRFGKLKAIWPSSASRQVDGGD